MSNPLQQGTGIFESDVAEAGNWALIASPRWLADDLVADANRGHEVPLKWVKRLADDGVSNALMKDVKKAVRKIQARSRFDLNLKTGKCGWTFLAPTDDSFPDIETIYALVVARLIDAKLAKAIKLCASDGCPNYFVGERRGKWCSNTCGSKYRVRKKRKLDKQRQML